MPKNQISWRSVCPICSGLDVLGDKWTMLIIRDLITYETRTYSELLESPEHISTNILSDRLQLLSTMKLIERIRPDKPVRNNAFKLTERGKALRPTLEELGRWAYAHLKEYNSEMLSIDSEED
jgi:DNA-binding HxlR family transcriptional regulator